MPFAPVQHMRSSRKPNPPYANNNRWLLVGWQHQITLGTTAVAGCLPALGPSQMMSSLETGKEGGHGTRECDSPTAVWDVLRTWDTPLRKKKSGIFQDVKVERHKVVTMCETGPRDQPSACGRPRMRVPVKALRSTSPRGGPGPVMSRQAAAGRSIIGWRQACVDKQRERARRRASRGALGRGEACSSEGHNYQPLPFSRRV